MSTSKKNTDVNLDALKPSARGIAECLLRHGARVELHPVQSSLFSFHLDDGRHGYFYGSLPLGTSMIGGIVAREKHLSLHIARHYGLVVPEELITDSYEEAAEFLFQHETVVVKPTDGARGRDVVIDITSEKLLKAAWEQGEGDRIVQRQCPGQDIRVLMLDGEVLYAIYRHPAAVIGDGTHTVAELIAIENSTNPERNGTVPVSSIYPISESHAREYLGDDIYDSHVPKADEEYRVCGPANTSIGGTLELITDEAVIEAMLEPMRQMSRGLGLSLVGFDFMLDNKRQECVFIEYNVIPTVWTEKTDSIEKLVNYAIKNARK